MEWIVRDDREVPLYVPPPTWSHGQEKLVVHALVEADDDALEQLWKARHSAAQLGAFMLDRGSAHVGEQLAARSAIDEATFSGAIAQLEMLFPERRGWWSRLDRRGLPTLVWRAIEQNLATIDRLKELDGPAVLVDARTRVLSQLAVGLVEPERVGFGGAYDSRRGLLEDAIGFVARQPLRDVGLREDVEYLGRKARSQLARKPTARSFSGVETYWIVQRRDALRLAAQIKAIRPSGDEEAAQLQRLSTTLSAVAGTYLMSLTKWTDYALGSGSDLEPASLAGVFRVALR